MAAKKAPAAKPAAKKTTPRSKPAAKPTETNGTATVEDIAGRHTKDELVTAAKVEGVDVKSRDTKAEVAAKLGDARDDKVLVDNFTRRSGDDALFGHFVDVIAGDHAGRRGHYFEDVSHGTDGYPLRVLVRSRDEHNEMLEVDYKDVRPTDYMGGR